MNEAGADRIDGAMAATLGEGPNPLAELADLLVSSLEALARAGQADAACCMAGRACAVLRTTDAGQWRKFNVLLHRVGRLAGPVGT
ncbi:hypothetical protein ACTDI4_16865 [Mesorhizobium sp. PUT5]|uniref:hypothetical protein n=1 Tax=Mesorhizobium sp. PUT5 TaxID=3454629 RepID=UPI003FA492CE